MDAVCWNEGPLGGCLIGRKREQNFPLIDGEAVTVGVGSDGGGGRACGAPQLLQPDCLLLILSHVFSSLSSRTPINGRGSTADLIKWLAPPAGVSGVVENPAALTFSKPFCSKCLYLRCDAGRYWCRERSLLSFSQAADDMD